MATIVPSRHAAVVRRAGSGIKLTEALHSWRKRLWVQQVLRWTENGVIAGIVLACLLLLISRFVPWGTVLYWAIGVAIVSLLGALGAPLWHRPSFARSAHLVDARLLLHDPLSPAWQLPVDAPPIPAPNRREP